MGVDLCGCCAICLTNVALVTQPAQLAVLSIRPGCDGLLAFAFGLPDSAQHAR